MIAFEVYVNGEKQCVAGVGDIGVLTSILTWRGNQPDENGTPGEPLLQLEVGGLISRSQEHVRWLDRCISVGDEVQIRVVDATVVDKPEPS